MRQASGRLRTYQLVSLVLVILLGYVMLSRNILRISDLILLACVVPSIILHEVSHGVVALAFGDDTAKSAGRLTLNPIRHIDPFGTVLLPVLLAFSGLPVFGYAKPVPVNVGRLRNPRNHGLLVSLAGPATNAVLALAAALIVRTWFQNGGLGFVILRDFGLVNTMLCAFNLIPIPPLDGSAVVERLLPKVWWPAYLRLRQFALPIILVIALVAPGGILYLIQPALSLWMHIAS